MPHIWVEYSSNLADEPEIGTLKQKVYDSAVATGIFPVAGIRVRFNRIDDYIVADQHPDNGFVHIVIRIGIGRDDETKKKTADTIFDDLCKHLEPLFQRNPLAFAFEIQEMHPELNYKKNNLRTIMAERQKSAE